MPAGRPHPAGALPSALDASFCAEVVCERVFSGERAVCGWDLTPARDPELLPEHIAVRFRGSRGDAELRADFLVRAARSDQCDDLALTIRQAERLTLALTAGAPSGG